MKLIKRNEYLNQLLDVKDIPDIKVITGVRRAGKSKLMDMFHQQIENENNNIIHIKLNLKEFSDLKNPDKLYDYVSRKYISSKNNYLLIDEIQMCNDFENIINSLHEEEKYDIYLTGSNAFLLSSDLATLFRGRVFEIKVFPFSFKEYVKYYETNDIDKSFDDYFKNGGMSGSYLYRNSQDALKYIEGIVKTTIVRDIVDKYKIENEDLLKLIAETLLEYETLTKEQIDYLVKHGKMPEEDENNLEALSVTKLREIAKEKGVKNYSKMTKAELLKELDV